MQAILLLAVLALPAAALAQLNEGPTDPIPVRKCAHTHQGEVCSGAVDGAGLTASNGDARVAGSDGAPSSRDVDAGAAAGAPYLRR